MKFLIFKTMCSALRVNNWLLVSQKTDVVTVLDLKIFSLLFAFICVCMSIHICYNVTSEDNLWELVLSFHQMGSRNPTLVARQSAGTFTHWGTSLSLNILSDSKEWNDILIILKYKHILWSLKTDSELSFPSSYPCTFLSYAFLWIFSRHYHCIGN